VPDAAAALVREAIGCAPAHGGVFRP